MPQAAEGNDITALALLANSLSKAEGKWSERLNHAAMVAAAGYSTYKFARNLHAKYGNKRTFEVQVPGHNDLYDSMIEWLYLNTTVDQRESIQATSGAPARREDDFGLVAPEGVERDVNIRLQYAGDRNQKFTWAGHWYEVRVEKLGTGKDTFFSQYNQMVFTCTTPEARESLVALFKEVERERKKAPPRLYVPRWGSWTAVDRKIVRSLGSVVLEEDLKERIVDDLDSFLKSEGKYAQLGLPFHRGYLFHGSPGTGKTSLAQALAAHFGLNVYYMPLADLNAEVGENLLRLVSSIPERAVLLLEDIDSLKTTHSREESDSNDDGPSLAAVLNTLDGALTPHGLITIATTNCVDVLDGALVRSGRFDVNEEIGNVSRDQVVKLFKMAYPEGEFDDLPEPKTGISPADVVDVFKTHFTNPTGAVEAYVERFGSDPLEDG